MEQLTSLINAAINTGNHYVWGYILVYVLGGFGIYLTVRSRFIQLRSFRHMMSVMFQSRESENGGVTSFQAFATSVAARVGTGNIAGVAVAITAGGPGAVFWMWVVAVVGMATSFVENTLGQAYKEKGFEEGTYRGGPAFYIEKGLGSRPFAIVFSVFLIISFGIAFNAIQANAVSSAVNDAFGLDPMLVGGIVIAVTALIIFRGTKSIMRFAEAVVPLMAILYLAISLVVVFMNISELPGVILSIVQSAFGLQEAAGGAIGVAIMQGVKRGLFSNEAGMGSSPNAGATAEVGHPASQGYVQMFSVFIDTIVICTCTASIILLSVGAGTGEGVELTQGALASLVGDWGRSFIAIALVFFAFTSIIANYYYAETNIYYIGHSKQAVFGFKVITLGIIFWGAHIASTGSSADFSTLWNFADLSMGLMATTNLIALVLLSKIAFALQKDYEGQLQAGVKKPTYNANRHKFKGIDPSIWNK